MIRTWIDRIAAGLLALAAALFFLWPAGPHPDDVEITITWTERPPKGREWAETRYYDVHVQWRWVKEPRPTLLGRPDPAVVLHIDFHRWSTTGLPWEEQLPLPHLGDSGGRWITRVPHGQDGELQFTLYERNGYEAESLPLRVQYLHRFSQHGWIPAGREWSKTEGGALPLR